jgi:hypothetical protein
MPIRRYNIKETGKPITFNATGMGIIEVGFSESVKNNDGSVSMIVFVDGKEYGLVKKLGDHKWSNELHPETIHTARCRAVDELITGKNALSAMNKEALKKAAKVDFVIKEKTVDEILRLFHVDTEAYRIAEHILNEVEKDTFALKDIICTWMEVNGYTVRRRVNSFVSRVTNIIMTKGYIERVDKGVYRFIGEPVL